MKRLQLPTLDTEQVKYENVAASNETIAALGNSLKPGAFLRRSGSV